jgi:hypothetical protein
LRISTRNNGGEQPSNYTSSLNAPATLFIEPLQSTCNCPYEHKSNQGSRSAAVLHCCTAPLPLNDRYRVELQQWLAHCRWLCAIHKETEKGRLCNNWRWFDNIIAAGRLNTRTGQRVRDLCILLEHQSRPYPEANVSSTYRLSAGSAVRITGEWQPSPPGKEQTHELQAHTVRALGENDSTVRYSTKLWFI